MTFLEIPSSGPASLRRYRHTVKVRQGPWLTVNDQQLLSFASNDYLGLAQHPRLIAEAQAALALWGVGGTASHLICGHTSAHQTAEMALAEFVGMPASLLFSCGYQANLAVLTTLFDRRDTLFADKLNHASLIDGACLSRAQIYRYRHLDYRHLETLLAKSTAEQKCIVSDTVFSMDGDQADLETLLDLAERYQAWLFLDDAHGFGLLGSCGSGSLTERFSASQRVIYMATLGKAAGIAGAFVASTSAVIDRLLQKARTYIYTTALPPALAAVIPVSLALIRQGDMLRQRLNQNIRLLQTGFAAAAPATLLPSHTAVQPVFLGENTLALAWQEALRAKGLWVPAIRPPTVPEGTARLRISLSAAHSEADVAQLISTCQAIAGTGLDEIQQESCSNVSCR